jgi:DNA ligase-1
MLAQAIDEAVDFAKLDPADYAAEWKWDGIRVQAVSERGERRLYTRTGDDISATFPDVVEALTSRARSTASCW